jgi:hypothetical protein
MNMKRIISYCVGILFLNFNAFAQDENCELTLAHATDEFQGGHFYSIPSILSPCLSKFTPEQQQRAYVLLTQTYLLLDDPISARDSYLKILKVNPEFVADENIHPSDFVYLSKKFISSPVFAWFVKGGANVSPVRVIHDLDVFKNDAVESYRLRAGYQAAFGGDFYINDILGVRAELNYMFATYQHSTSNFFQEDNKEFFENQTWLSVPVSVMYSDFQGTYRPYGYVGFSVGYLLRDVARGTIDKVRTAEDESDSQRSPDWDFLYKRNNTNYSIIAGGGTKVKMGVNFLFVDVRYSFGMKNVVNSDNLYVNNELPLTTDEFITSYAPTSSFAHVDDYFRLDNLSVSIGFLRPIYKPRDHRIPRASFVFRKRKKLKE